MTDPPTELDAQVWPNEVAMRPRDPDVFAGGAGKVCKGSEEHGEPRMAVIRLLP